MNRDLLQILNCPSCSENLDIIPIEDNGDTITNGFLICKGCERTFAIIRGIPRLVLEDLWYLVDFDFFSNYSNFLTGDYYNLFLERHNNKHRNTEAEWILEETEFWDTNYQKGYEMKSLNRIYPRDKYVFKNLRRNIKSKVLIEVGCGTSGTIEKLMNSDKYHYRYIGTDTSVRALEIAKNKFRTADFIQCSANKLPFCNKAADILLMFGVLRYVPGREENIKGFFDVIKENGIFAMYDSINRPKGLSRFKYFRDMLPQGSKHDVPIEMESLIENVCKEGVILLNKKEYSSLRTVLVKLIGNLADKSLIATKMVILLDRVCIWLLGRLLPFMDGGAIFIVAKKRTYNQ